MPTLAELKASSPAYASMPDQEFAERVYRKHYADKMSFGEFSQRTGNDRGAFANVGAQASPVVAQDDGPSSQNRLFDDPQAATNPSLFRADSDFRERSGAGVMDMLGAAARDMFVSEESAAKYLAEQHNERRGLSSLNDGGARVGADADGSPVLKLPDGSSYRLNDAGLDTSDAANLAGNVAAFWSPAAWAAKLGQAKSLGLGARTGLQALTAGSTDATLQASVTGGELDAGHTGMAIAGGALGEVAGSALGAGINRLDAARRTATGVNARQAQTMFANAGVQQPPPSALARLAGGVEEIRAGADPNAILGRELYGFQYTQGQRTADPVRRFDQLSREEALRQAPGAGGVFTRAQDANAARLGEVVDTMGQRMGGQPGANPGALAQSAAGRLQSQADELGGKVSDAYTKAGEGGRTAVGVDAVAALPDRMARAVGDFAPNPELTPATSRTIAQIREAVAQAQQGNVKGVTLKAIETQRRIIGNNIGAAANPTDRAAMMAVKREFDGWLDESVESALISGDPAALAALKDARALRFEYGRRFEGKGDTDRFITGLLDGTKTPEELLNVALGAGQVSKAGGARFIERLRKAADGDPQVVGSLRAAHFQRMTTGTNGQPLGMGQIVRNIKATEYNNASVLRALYSPAEWAEVKRLAAALDPLIAKGDFARSSGSAERIGRMMFQKVGGGLPVVGELVRAVGDVRATAHASRALNQPLRLRTQPVQGSHAVTAGMLAGSQR